MGFGHNTIPFIDTLYTSAITAPPYFQSGILFFNYICRQEEKVEEKAEGKVCEEEEEKEDQEGEE